MADNPSQNSEFRRMNAVAEASTLMRVLAEPASPGEGVKAAIRRAARRAGLDTGLGKRLWYGEARRIDSDTMDRLRHAAGDQTALEEALAARTTVLARLAACEAALGLSDTNDDREVGAAARGRLGPAHRAVAGERVATDRLSSRGRA